MLSVLRMDKFYGQFQNTPDQLDLTKHYDAPSILRKSIQKTSLNNKRFTFAKIESFSTL
jgi:hypothetical protein